MVVHPLSSFLYLKNSFSFLVIQESLKLCTIFLSTSVKSLTLFFLAGMNPKRTYPDWYKNVVSLWILFGMAWLALIINLCISLVENSRRLCRCCKTKSHTIGEELMNGNPHINLEPEDQQKCGVKDIKPVRLDWIWKLHSFTHFSIEEGKHLQALVNVSCATMRKVATWEVI